MEQLQAFPEPPRHSSLDGYLAESVEVVERAKADHAVYRTFLLLSGGNDSLVLLDTMASLADEIVHIDTGIGIPETNAFAERVARRYDLPYTVLTPPTSYEELVFGRWRGMPGPGAHRYTYQRLKERCVEALIRSHRTKRGQRFGLMTGVRRAESRRRMGYGDPVNRKGGQVWINPLLWWPNEEMTGYRSAQSLPVNEVSANLHMSGECLCGAMADQGEDREERAAIRFFYPEFDRRLCEMENECRNRGLPYTEWGVKRDPKAVAADHEAAGMLCQSCAYRQPSLDFGAAS